MEELIPRVEAVTFDFGQTLCDLDAGMLARRLGERGIQVPAELIRASLHDAWRAYDDAILAGFGGHPWKILMTRLLELSGVPELERAAAVDWLWTEQPSQNLWRHPIPGMLELCRELRDAGVKLGVISNSEGRLAELVEELGLHDLFLVVADSGRLGLEKPDPAIFRWTLEGMGACAATTVHVGDAWGADIDGARRAGLRAVWFQGRGARELPPEVKPAGDAAGVWAALEAFGLQVKRPGRRP